MAKYFLVVLVLCSPFARAETLLEKIQSFGDQVTCESLDGADACVIKKPALVSPKLNYSRPIVVVIPRYEEQPLERPSTVVLHLQGYRGVCASKDGEVDTNASPLQMLENFNLVPQFLAATQNDPNAVLVFPMSMGKNDDYNSQLVGQFKLFFSWVNTITAASPDSHWVISGHSGAGSVISRSLASATSIVPKVHSILLLDATYGIPNRLAEWKKIANAHSELTIESVYKIDTSTESGSKLLQRELNRTSFSKHDFARSRVEILSTTRSHCSIPNKFFGEMLARALN